MGSPELQALLGRLEELNRRADQLLAATATGAAIDSRPDLITAILECLGERIHDKRSLAAALNARGHPVTPSSVNSHLYELRRTKRVTCIEGQPPLWRLPRTEDAEYAAPALRPKNLFADAAPVSTRVDDLNFDHVGLLNHRIWRIARDEATLVRDHLRKEPLLATVAGRAAVSKAQVERVLRLRLPSLRGPDLRKLKAPDPAAPPVPSPWRELLNRNLVTPAGNLRSGPVVITTGGRAPADPGTIQILTTTGDRPLWVCVLIRHPREWDELANSAEILSDGWGLPLRPAKGRTPHLPAPLIWRVKEANTAIRLVALLLEDLTDADPGSVDIQVPLQAKSVGHKNDPEAEVRRLVRRRGAIPKGRKYPSAAPAICAACL